VWFKTKKIKTSVWSLKKSILFFAWFLSITLICFLWISIVNNIKELDFKFNLWNIISGFKFNLNTNQNEDDKIKILLIWRWWGNHSGWELTDSIILASIDLKEKVISMLSIPRDLYVKYWDWRYWKINWVYAHYLSTEKTENWAMEYLKNKISQITWEKIDYYVNIDFSWFKQVVDVLWWVTIDVPENFADYSYPTENWWYTTFILKKWTWNIDWETALKYARSRHSTSDFDRSLRQQKILSAIKEKMITEWYLKNPIKIKKMYNTISPYFTTDIWLNWILKIASDFKDFSGTWSSIISLNLNNSCVYWTAVCEVWWILYTPPMESFWWASVVLPRWASNSNLEKYGEIQRFASIIFNYPSVFIDKQEINIFNSLPIANQALYLANDLQQFWFHIPEKDSIWNTDWLIYEQTTILYNNLWKDTETLNALKLFIKWKYEEVKAPLYSKNPDTKIEIVIWKDLKDITDFDWEEAVSEEK
jgi:LCP family protein required for cell wall assembly